MKQQKSAVLHCFCSDHIFSWGPRQESHSDIGKMHHVIMGGMYAFMSLFTESCTCIRMHLIILNSAVKPNKTVRAITFLSMKLKCNLSR